MVKSLTAFVTLDAVSAFMNNKCGQSNNCAISLLTKIKYLKKFKRTCCPTFGVTKHI